MYIVKYSKGEYEDYREINIFVTENKQDAIYYCNRFNSILRKWKDYYNELFSGYDYLEEDVRYEFHHRWYILNEINSCEYKEIEVRNLKNIYIPDEFGQMKSMYHIYNKNKII